MFDRAFESFTRMAESNERPPEEIAAFREEYNLRGWKAFRQLWLEEEIRRGGEESPYDTAARHALVGDKDKAFE
jgi:hypothetical protein